MKEENTKEAFDASFRIIRENLDPNEINTLLGIKPDHSHRKGDPNNRKSKSGKIIVGSPHKIGVWSINSTLPETSSLQEHILHILQRVEPVSDKINKLSEEGYRVDIFCGYFFTRETKGGFDISSDILERMGKMGISLGVSTYDM